MQISYTETGGITRPQNILLQGTKNMSIASFAEGVPVSVGNFLSWLKLTAAPKSLLTRLRLQASVFQPVVSGYTDLRFEAYIYTSQQSVDSLTDRVFLGRSENLVFGEENGVDIVFDLPSLTLLDTFYLTIAAAYTYYGYGVPMSGYVTHTSTANGAKFRIYSISFEDMPVGCEGVQVRSLDDRLVSTTGNKTITYPVLFLGRDPVREDAQGLKEVLVFQDRATTLRVTPQPLVLSEENEYSQNAVAASNGHWMLYEYDTIKLRCSLDSGLPVTGGVGNDVVHVSKSSTFLTYGLYNLPLLFATDTSDEPYIVPVVLDYAVPLSVNGMTKVLNITLNEQNQCVPLEIVRDRLWKIIGFPVDDLTVGVINGVRNTKTTLCMREDYSRLGTTTFTFIVQSGIKRVVVNVTVTVYKLFTSSKDYVLLTLGNSYTQKIHIKRYNYGSTAAGDFGYSFNIPAEHTVTRTSLGTTAPAGVADGTEPAGTIYDEITITYTGNQTNPPAGQHGSDTKITFMTDADVSTVSATCYRNIERNFDIHGTNNRPTGNNAAWSFVKLITQASHTVTGSAWKYITPATDPNRTAEFYVKANQAVKASGGELVSTGDAMDYSDVGNGKNILFRSGAAFLNKNYTVQLELASYYRYKHNAQNTSVESETVAAVSVSVQFETRYPHFLNVSDVYLQYDNNWTQHHWLLTNPDAVISFQSNTSGGRITCSPTSGYTAGDLLAKIQKNSANDPSLDIYTVNVRSTVPPSIANNTWLSSPARTIDKTFRTVVYHPVLLRNEIIPHMLAANQEMNIADEQVPSSLLVSGNMTANDYRLFNRNNRENVSTVFNASKNRLRGSNYTSRQNTASFLVEFDTVHVIRSWSYTVEGCRSIACGFLIEGWLDGMDVWEPISAVTDYDTQSASTPNNGIVVDYVTVAPKPWSRIRVTVTQVRNSGGSLVAADQTPSGTFKVGQFQFYEGYPVLKRVTSIGKGNKADPYQLNTHGGKAAYIARNEAYVAVSVSDGKLLPAVELAQGTLDGIDEVGYYNANQYWNYRLVNDAVNNLMPFASSIACMGIKLDATIQVIGLRYDTGIVAGYSTAGAVAVETSPNSVTTSGGMTTVGSYTPLAIVNTQRYLGQGTLPGLSSLNLDANAVARLNQFATEAQLVIYGAAHPPQVIEGTVVLRVDTDNNDYRLLRFSGGTWNNIGQDIIYDSGGALPDSTSLLSNNGSALRTLAHNWMRIFDTGHQNTQPLRDKIALTNPTDQRRLLYDLTSDTWSDIGEYRFEPYRGRQYYRNVVRSGVVSIRVYIPGLADTSDIRSGAEKIRAIAGEIQMFEQFQGTDIAYKDIRVNGTSVKYGEAVTMTDATTVNVSCDGLMVNGSPAPESRLFAQTRQANSLSWAAVAQTGGNSVVTHEGSHIVTSVTLFYRKDDTTASRMYPFFTFTIVHS